MVEGLHLSPRHRKEIVALLHKHLPDVEVWAYGSRVNGRSHDGSDLDLVLRGPKLAEIDTSRLADFIEALQDSTIPFLVEVRDWARLPESFHHEIEREHVALVEREESLGLASDGWVSLSLGEVCIKIGSGATPRGGKEVYLKDGPYALIRSQNVYNHRFNHDGLAFINQHQATELNNVEVFADDVLLNITGDSVARACQVAPDVLPARVNQHVAIIRPDPHKLSPRFLRYFLVCPEIQAMLLSWAGSGGTRNALTKGMIESFDVQAPMDVDEQHAIAHILGALDDKIELNRRMNETLEAMARALFKSWFVDFDPVRAKMEGRDIGLPKDIADLFPDRLVDSELGEIPEGWKVVPLSEIMNFKEGPGIRHWQYTNSAEGTRFINIRCIQDGDLLLSTSNRITTEEADGKYAHFHLKEGDIVVSSSGTLGRSAVVRKAHLPLLLNTSVIRFRPVGGVTSFSYLHGYLNSSIFLDELKSLATGSVQKNVGPTHLKKMRVLFPPYNCIERYEEIAGPFLQKVNIKRTDNTALAGLRDTLLPRLVSGEVRVNVSGQRIEEAM